jgi:precorrin-2 dehydrogenase/sirohydrochlorin ferrochelatase
VDKGKANYYPVCLNLKNKLCLVVGAGKVAGRKVRSLLEAGARVTVVSPEAEKEIEQAAGEGSIVWKRKVFSDSDLEGNFLVVGATDDRELNRRIFSLADSAGVLVNVVDEPELCNFIVPAVLRRGDFQIAVSSGGASPVLARAVRDDLERQYSDIYGEIIERMSALRLWLKEQLPDEKKRRQFWEEFVDLDFFESLEDGDIEAKFKERIVTCLSRLVD